MKDFFKSWFYIIKTGDGKAKAFYLMAFIAFVILAVGTIAGIIAFIPTVIAGKAQFLPLIISGITLILAGGIIFWLNRLRGI